MRGARVLWGRSHEEAGAPPYWPWVQIGRMFGAANDIALLRPGMGAAFGELVRLFPELQQQPGFTEPEAINDPQSGQFRLFDAYATFLRAMAAGGPMIIALDDLHWAAEQVFSLTVDSALTRVRRGKLKVALRSSVS